MGKQSGEFRQKFGEEIEKQKLRFSRQLEENRSDASKDGTQIFGGEGGGFEAAADDAEGERQFLIGGLNQMGWLEKPVQVVKDGLKPRRRLAFQQHSRIERQDVADDEIDELRRGGWCRGVFLVRIPIVGRMQREEGNEAFSQIRKELPRERGTKTRFGLDVELGREFE